MHIDPRPAQHRGNPLVAFLISVDPNHQKKEKSPYIHCQATVLEAVGARAFRGVAYGVRQMSIIVVRTGRVAPWRIRADLRPPKQRLEEVGGWVVD